MVVVWPGKIDGRVAQLFVGPFPWFDSHDAPPPGAEGGMTSSLSYGQKPQKDMSLLKAGESAIYSPLLLVGIS